MNDALLDRLRARAADLLPRAYTPYSARPNAVVLLCEGGVLIPGVRVESATFPLTISASLNAITTAVGLGAPRVLAVAATAPFDAYDAALWRSNTVAPMTQVDEDFAHAGEPLPEPGTFAEPFLPGEAATTMEAGITAAQAAASRAFVPASDFPVGCALRVRTDAATTRFVPGCNVEPGAWPFTLCGERNALTTLLSYGLAPPEAAFLACLRDPGASPCGACRQLLCEHLAETPLWQDRGAEAPEQTTPQALLPGFFAGTTLVKA